MLPYYAARFPTVEINHYTFYRMPTEKLVGGWAAQTPSPYKLTLKAPRRITHDNRLKNVGELVKGFCQVAGTLGGKLGALLFQLPPNLKKDLATFRRVPRRAARRRSAPRSSSVTRRGSTRRSTRAWRRGNLALCVADSDKMSTPVKVTADYGYYFRLRDEGLHRRRHQALGRHDRARDRILQGTCSSISSTRKKARGRNSRSY